MVWAAVAAVAAVVVAPPTRTSLALLEPVVVLAVEGVVEGTALAAAPALPVVMAVHLAAAHQHRQTAALVVPVVSALAEELVVRVATVVMEPAGLVERAAMEPQRGQALVVLAARSALPLQAQPLLVRRRELLVVLAALQVRRTRYVGRIKEGVWAVPQAAQPAAMVGFVLPTRPEAKECNGFRPDTERDGDARHRHF